MTALDTKLRSLAVSLLSQYGKTITLSKNTESAYNPATGLSQNIDISYAVKATVEAAKVHFGSSDLVQQNDLAVTIAAQGIEPPASGDSVTIDGLVYRVISVIAVYSGEMVALYKLQVR